MIKVTVEGPAGVGKSTVVQIIQQALLGYDVSKVTIKGDYESKPDDELQSAATGLEVTIEESQSSRTE